MIDLGGILGAIIIGGIAGWLASLIMGANQSMGLIANILVGVVGAVIGNILFGLFGAEGTTGFSLQSLIVALIGAVILLFIVKLFTRGSSTVA